MPSDLLESFRSIMLQSPYPVSEESTVGLSFFRSGVNDIKNTLNAWDAERNQPKPNPELYVSSFSAADVAIFVSYARRIRSKLNVGLSGKVIRRTIGDFADAWGYSFDAGIQWLGRRIVLGAQVQDVSTMLQSWSVNPSAFKIDGTNPATGFPYTFSGRICAGVAVWRDVLGAASAAAWVWHRLAGWIN